MRISPTNRDRYESITKRDFKTALIRLLESEYKIIGSHRVLLMLADDIEQLHQEYYPQRNRLRSGDVVWQTTKDDGQPSELRKENRVVRHPDSDLTIDTR